MDEFENREEYKPVYGPWDMEIMGIGLPWHATKAAMYYIFQYAYGFLQAIWWMLTGTYKKRQESKKPENYHFSAHVMDIKARFAFDNIMSVYSEANFVTNHHSFQHPEYVLKDNIELILVKEKETLFVEAKEGVQIWRRACSPFLRHAYMNYAVRIIIMPTASFHRLADKVGDPKGKLIFIPNIARCGGTLLCRIFEGSGKCVSFCEPPCLNSIAYYYEKGIDEKVLERLSHSIVRMLCKPVSCPDEVVSYIMKPTAMTMAMIPFLSKVYPDSRQLFIYRSPETMAASIYKVSHKLPLVKLMFVLGRVHGWFTQQICYSMHLGAADLNYRITNPVLLGMVVYAACVKKYQEYYEDGCNVVAVRFEDIVKDSKFAFSRIIEHCGLPMELLEPALASMALDSQHNSPISRKLVAKYKTLPFSPEIAAECNKIADKFHVPRFRYEEQCKMPGLITHHELQ